MASGHQKIEGLQFLRAIAIAGVLIYHLFFAIYSPTLGWRLSPIGFGFLGVQLFFMISGYVISKSLASTDSMMSFLLKRFIRLLPSLVLIILVLYSISASWTESPFHAESKIYNLIPSLTLVPPEILNLFSKVHFANITGVLWSLNAEVIFYLIAALFFYMISKQKHFLTIFHFTSLGISILYVIGCINVNLLSDGTLFRIIIALRLQNLSWFGIGIWLYSVEKLRSASLKMKIVFLSLVLQSLSTHFFLIHTEDLLKWFEVFYSTMLIVIFIRVGGRKNISKNIFNRFALFIGDSSYELYLIHYGTLLPLIVYLQMRNFSHLFISLYIAFAVVALVISSVLIRFCVSEPLSLTLKKNCK
jgi:peptidoglycan/LPS O-acetylase OafA/YrhL